MDLLALGWRSQFDIDFIIHLFLLAAWVTWREGADARAYIFGFLSIVMGGMFSFPYILYATYKAGGEPKALLLGIHTRLRTKKGSSRLLRSLGPAKAGPLTKR
jgi:hypothetical protein